MKLSQLILRAAAVWSLCISGAALAADRAPEMIPYGTAYKGNGVEIEMAEFAEKNKNGLNDVLLKIVGQAAFKEGIDGKVIRYTAVHGGTGIDYQVNGNNRMIVRNPYGNSWALVEVYLDGKTIYVRADASASKQVRPLHLLAESLGDK